MTKRSMQSSNLDFVITWVDGSDPAWLDEKSHFASGSEADNRKERYRDWDHLKYWFRGIEKNAPWVHNIYFVTWGHLPAWLNTAHPKLHIINTRILFHRSICRLIIRILLN